MADVEILVGDVFDRLADLPDDSVDCVVTSPPYWGLRDYGVEGQIGLEATMSDHINKMVWVFEAVRRVLKPTGTLWVNYGDAYATTPNGKTHLTGDKRVRSDKDDRTFTDKPVNTAAQSGLPSKSLLMLPARLAIALQDAGWLLRSEIIWAKPNPMPESAKDRPTQAHEKIFLFSKSARYFYDADAVKEPARYGEPNSPHAIKSPYGQGYTRRAASSAGSNGRIVIEGRNLRNVWTIPSSPFPDAHFATFPPALAERCIKAGCPAGGHVLDPFGGAGTTGLVAARLGRSATLIELNPEYAKIARRRIAREDPYTEQTAPCGAVQIPLFESGGETNRAVPERAAGDGCPSHAGRATLKAEA